MEKILDTYGMSRCKPSESPTATASDLDGHENSPLCDKTKYQEIVGSLLYLSSTTRPDLSFVVANLTRYCHEPKVCHLNAAKQVLRYVQATKNYKFSFPRDVGSQVLSGQSDASWSSTKDGKGFSSHMIKLWGSVITWKTVKQHLTALSSAEAELMALVQCLKDLMWVRGLMVELGFQEGLKYPIRIETDSQAVINTVNSLGLSPRTKHYRRLVTFVKDEVEKGNIELVFIAGKEISADLLTKVFSGRSLNSRIGELGIVSG
jgi:hypothetical protein